MSLSRKESQSHSVGTNSQQPPSDGNASLLILKRWLNAVGYVTEREWRTRKSAFVLYSPSTAAGDPWLLMKQTYTWSEGEAEAAFAVLDRCRKVVDADRNGHFVPRPRWWGGSPPFLCVEWVQGVTLTDLFHDRLSSTEALPPPDWLFEVFFRVGAGLARYHSAFDDWVASHGVHGETGESAEDGRLQRTALLLAGKAAASSGFPVRTIVDPRAKNLVMDHDGGIWLIDLPVTSRVRLAQWDIARLALRLHRSVKRAMSDRRPAPIRLKEDEVIEALLRGYSSYASCDLSTTESMVLIQSFLASESLLRAFTAFRKKETSLAAALSEGGRAASACIRSLIVSRR